MGPHEHACWQLSYTVIGSGVRTIGDNSDLFDSGEIVLIPPHIPHCFRFDETNTDEKGRIVNICILFHPNLLHNIAQCFPTLSERMQKLEEDERIRFFNRKHHNSIAQIMRKMDKETEDERVASILRLLILISDDQAVSQWVAHKKIDIIQNRITQITNYIVCNAQRDIRLDQIAQHVGMSKSGFCVFLKSKTGLTFCEYLNNIRIEKACELLQKEGVPIKEVGYSVGYNSTSYFIRTFIKLKGCSPKEYRAAQLSPKQ